MHKIPFLRLFVPLAAGACLQMLAPLPPWWLAGMLLPPLALAVYAYLPLSKQYVYNSLRGLLLYLLLAAAGCVLVLVRDVRNSRYYLGSIAQPGDLLFMHVQEPLQERPRSYRTVAAVTAVMRNGRPLPAKGKVLLYFQKDSMVAALAPGSVLLAPNKLQSVRSSGNPGAFDYSRYCAYRQIHHQLYIRKAQWKKLPLQGAGRLSRWLFAARSHCLGTLQTYIHNREDAALAAALLIGYRYDLDREMVQAYTGAGVVHIIAISGMHLALIYAALLWLLQWWPAHRHAHLLKAGVIMALLWGFALITGAPASVLRATVMFTVMVTGRFVLERYASIYNTLAASAFLLLCHDPYLLADAGFQLSYLAVLGIVLCYRPLYNSWVIKRPWLDKIWEAAAVTLAAQFLTLPLCLYYFHQFPNLFLPANLLVVGLSSLILYNLILLLLLSPLPAAAGYAGMAAGWLIRCMNKVVAFIEQLPFAVTDNIYMPLYAVIGAYLAIAALCLYLLAGEKKALLPMLCCCLTWCALYAADTWQSFRQRKAIVYNVPGYTAIDIIQGRQVRLAGDTALLRTPALYGMHLQPARLLYRVTAPPGPAAVHSGNFLSLGRKRLVIVDSTWRPFCPREKFRTDYILLSHNPRVDIRQLREMFGDAQLIFDGSNTSWRIQQWKNDCYALTLRCFSVPDQGAYLINY